MADGGRNFGFRASPQASWRLKLLGWWQIAWGALALFGLLQALVFVPALNASLGKGLSAKLWLAGAAALLLIGSRIYAGLLLLDRSRMAGVLVLLVVSSQLVVSLEEGPLYGISVVLGFLELVLIASVWKEFEGPFPLGLRSVQQVLLGVSALGLVVHLTPRTEIKLSPEEDRSDHITFIGPDRAEDDPPRFSRWAQLATEEIPGFAGIGILWTKRDSVTDCILSVMLTDPPRQRPKAVSALPRETLIAESGAPTTCASTFTIRYERARYDFKQLYSWYQMLRQENRRLQTSRPSARSTSVVSIDPRANMIRIFPAVSEDSTRLRMYADSLGVPRNALSIAAFGRLFR